MEVPIYEISFLELLFLIDKILLLKFNKDNSILVYRVDRFNLMDFEYLE